METQTPPPSVPWSAREVWLGLVLVGGPWLLFYLFLRFLGRPRFIDPDLAILGMIAGEGLMLLPVWWFARRRHGAGWRDLGLRSFPAGTFFRGLGLVILILVFDSLYGAVLEKMGVRPDLDLSEIFRRLSHPGLFFFGGVVVAPVVEEIFFRGFVFTGLRERFGWGKAALISSLLFALIHLRPFIVLPIFLLGWLFAYLYQRCGSIVPAILLHALVNGLALAAAFLQAAGAFPRDF